MPKSRGLHSGQVEECEVGVVHVDIRPENLLGQSFLLVTGYDSIAGWQTKHEATVIALNPVSPDSILVELSPPLPKGRYLEPKYFPQPWRKQVEQIEKVVLLPRAQMTRVCPPCPSFPIAVHIYAWPDPPIVRDQIWWSHPDDWGHLFYDKEIEDEVRNNFCVEAITKDPNYFKFGFPPPPRTPGKPIEQLKQFACCMLAALPILLLYWLYELVRGRHLDAAP